MSAQFDFSLDLMKTILEALSTTKSELIYALRLGESERVRHHVHDLEHAKLISSCTDEGGTSCRLTEKGANLRAALATQDGYDLTIKIISSNEAFLRSAHPASVLVEGFDQLQSARRPAPPAINRRTFTNAELHAV